jgi:superfamily II DNA or RNA helicase
MAITRPKKTQDQIQQEARDAFHKNGGFGTVAACTGAGKTKIAVDETRDICTLKPDAKILVVVPTETLRDKNWLDEFVQWEATSYYENNVTRTCYASLNKIKDKSWDLVVLDEGHHITPNHLDFFENNDVFSLLVLTATFPKKGDKKEILQIIAPKVYTYTLAEGMYDGVIDEFEIDVLYVPLDGKNKTIKAGSKTKPFLQTEAAAYKYIDNRFNELKFAYTESYKKWKEAKDQLDFGPFQLRKEYEALELKCKKEKDGKYFMWQRYIGIRKRFIENLPSKTEAGKRVMNSFFHSDLRWLVFCGSIPQAEELCGKQVFHSKQKKGEKNQAYDDFKSQKTNLLGSVNAINEGHNLPNIDDILAAQLNSQELNIIQRIGRAVRRKKGRLRPAKVRILCAKGSQDEEWVETALEEFDESIITYYDFEDYMKTFK